MKFNHNVFDLWVYHLADGMPKYFLIQASQKKADKWFRGVRFWQIPSDFFEDGETVQVALLRVLEKYSFSTKSLWAVEYAYTFYNRRFEEIQLCTAYAAEVERPDDVQLTDGHSSYGWFTSDESFAKLRYRGLIEGLKWTMHYVTESPRDYDELRLM